LLAIVDTFSGWPEAFLWHTNKAREIVKVLLKQRIPGFGILRDFRQIGDPIL